MGLFMPFQIADLVGAVAAALMVTLMHSECLVGAQVNPFVPFQVAHVLGAVIAAFMVTWVHLGYPVGRQAGLFVCFQMVNRVHFCHV